MKSDYLRRVEARIRTRRRENAAVARRALKRLAARRKAKKKARRMLNDIHRRITALQVGAVINALRHERLWTQAELAKRAGVSAALISQYETGRRTPRIKTGEKLAQALGVKMARLLE